MIDQIKNISIIIGLFVILIKGVQWVDDYFAKSRETDIKIVEIEQVVVGESIAQDAAWAASYRRKMKEGTATEAEAERLESLERQLGRKYKKSERLETIQRALEEE